MEENGNLAQDNVQLETKNSLLQELVPFGLTALVGVVLGASLFFTLPVGDTATNQAAVIQSRSEEVTNYHVTEILEKEFFDEAYANAADFGDRKEARVLILPHHLVARPLIAGALQSQAKVKNPKTIVIIGPDHLNRADRPIVTTNLQWRTPFGFMHPDDAYIDALVKNELVTIDNDVFDVEHSVSALIPFLHRTFPDAKIVPLLVQEELDADLSYAVADLLAQDMVMLVASVDFSHYLTDEVAQFHDVNAIDAIKARDYDALPNLEIDSRASLGFAFDFAEQTATEEFDLYANENSNSFFGYEIPETTSYVVGGFVEGFRGESEVVTILSVGDMMFDRGVKGKMNRNGFEYPFEGIRGIENRFFRGIDIILGNLEGSIAPRGLPDKKHDFSFEDDVADLLKEHNFSAVSLANNHSFDQGEVGYEITKEKLSAAGVGHYGSQYDINSNISVWKEKHSGKIVSVVGINTIETDFVEKDVADVMKDVDQNSDIVVVQIHWGEEFQTEASEKQKVLGRTLVDLGADAVIGHHPHVIQGMEIYKGAPIFWSVGNFIFDQEISSETSFGLAVGLAFDSLGSTAYIFPVLSENYRPVIALEPVREQILEAFLERSTIDIDVAGMVRKGIIRINK